MLLTLIFNHYIPFWLILEEKALTQPIFYLRTLIGNSIKQLITDSCGYCFLSACTLASRILYPSAPDNFKITHIMAKFLVIVAEMIYWIVYFETFSKPECFSFIYESGIEIEILKSSFICFRMRLGNNQSVRFCSAQWMDRIFIWW